jgi:hypothetical protein
MNISTQVSNGLSKALHRMHSKVVQIFGLEKETIMMFEENNVVHVIQQQFY